MENIKLITFNSLCDFILDSKTPSNLIVEVVKKGIGVYINEPNSLKERQQLVAELKLYYEKYNHTPKEQEKPLFLGNDNLSELSTSELIKRAEIIRKATK